MATITFNTTTILDPNTDEGFHIRVETAFGLVMIADVVDTEVEVRPVGTNVTTGWVFYWDAVKEARRHYIETGLRRVGLGGVKIMGIPK